MVSSSIIYDEFLTCSIPYTLRGRWQERQKAEARVVLVRGAARYTCCIVTQAHEDCRVVYLETEA